MPPPPRPPPAPRPPRVGSLVARGAAGAVCGFAGVAALVALVTALGDGRAGGGAGEPVQPAVVAPPVDTSSVPAAAAWPATCDDAAWHLKRQSWDDGRGGGPPAGVCALAPGARAGDTGDCGAAISVPKVALMFLTAGTLPHAATWEAWLDRAAGLVPTDCAAAAACGGKGGSDASAARRVSAALSSCDASASSLFSVYVHVPKGVPLNVSSDSRFAGAVIADRVATEWGGFTLADATRRLLAAALADPRNQRFALLSESCVPLYSPQAAYTQLMYNPKSRINACPDGVKPDWPLDDYRYTWRMADATHGALTADKWRKSHQWIGLTRKHAAAVAADEAVAAAFRAHCTNAPDADLGGAWRSCFSDEHYFPVVLALAGWDDETDCEGDMTHTIWCRGWHCVGDAKLHPKTHTPAEVSATDFLQSLRRAPPVSIGAEPGPPCHDTAAAAAAGRLLAHAREVAAGRAAAPPRGKDAAALVGGRCSLFARKFKADAAAGVAAAVASVCDEDERAG